MKLIHILLSVLLYLSVLLLAKSKAEGEEEEKKKGNEIPEECVEFDPCMFGAKKNGKVNLLVLLLLLLIIYIYIYNLYNN